jgi:hypothetical protein
VPLKDFVASANNHFIRAIWSPITSNLIEKQSEQIFTNFRQLTGGAIGAKAENEFECHATGQ